MATVLPRYLKYLSFLMMIFAVLYKYEIPVDESTAASNRTTWVLSKIATVHQERAHVYRIIANIDKYATVCHIDGCSSEKDAPLSLF